MKTFTTIVASMIGLSGLFAAPRAYAQPDENHEGEFYRVGSREVEFDRARAAQRERDLARPGFARSVLESAGLLVVGSVWYWASRDLNSEDWDIEPNFKAVSKRFTTLDHIRFDSNEFWVNEGHVGAGALYYAAPRTSGFGPLGSLAFAALTSAAWEWGIEFRENISLNDLVTSPYGGQALGEVLYKWGELHRIMSGDLPFAARAVTAPFSGPHAFHDWLDGVGRPDWDPELGTPMYHDFQAAGGVRIRRANETAALGTIGFDTTIVDMPGYGRQGRFNSYFADGNHTRLHLDLAFSGNRLESLDVSARAILLGYFHQSISDLGYGWGAMVGLTRGAWVVTENRGRFRDQLGMIDLLGPRLLLNGYLGPLKVGAELSGFLDFGSVRSESYGLAQHRFAPGQIRTELEREGYYFGWGLLMIPEVWAELGPLRLGGQAQWVRFRELNFPDRIHQGDIPTELDLLDERLVLRAQLDVALHPSVALRGSVQRRVRTSQLDEAERVDDRVDQLGAAVVFRF